jgi:hypothetical protein
MRVLWTIISPAQHRIANVILARTKDAEYLLFYSEQT